MDTDKRYSSEFTLRSKKNGILNRNDLSYNDIIITKRIYRESAKRSDLSSVSFINSQIVRSAFAGSILRNVDFINTKILGNAWTFCVFSDCTFKNENANIKFSSNFSNSSFYNCTFENVNFGSCSFIKSQFINCRFKDCIIASSTFEDAVFQSCLFERDDIGSTNLEFCEFKDCRFKDCILPLYQICYVINGMEHVLNMENSIVIRSNNGLYTLDDLYRLSSQMNEYYTITNQYFALANTFVISGNYKAIKDIIFEGINYYLARKNFRMIKHLCRLGKSKGVLDVHQSKEILDTVDNFLITYKSNQEELSSYIMHSSDLRTLLYDNNGNEAILTTEIQTTILPEESDKINLLLSEISSMFDGYSDVNHSIQIRHNSPFLLFCTVVGAVASLVAISEALIKGGIFVYKQVKKRKESKSSKKPDEENADINNIDNGSKACRPTSSPADITCNSSGNIQINNYYVNGDVIINNDINVAITKLISEDGVSVTKIEKRDKTRDTDKDDN